MTLRDVFHAVTKRQPDAWLFLPSESSTWNLDSDAILINPEYDDATDEQVLPEVVKQNDLRETIDTQTIADCVRWADRLAGRADDLVRLESFLYYVRWDAFLPKIGAPDPPPIEET